MRLWRSERTAADSVGKRFPLLDHVLIAVSVLVSALGMVVLLGWHTGDVNLIRVYPGFQPMAYNTAASFVILGLALAALGRGWRLAARLTASAVILLMSVSFVDYLNGLPLSSTTYLTRLTLPAGSAASTPVAPNTVLALLSLAIAVVLLSGWFSRLSTLLPAAAISIGLALGLNAIVGHLIGYETFRWGQFTSMATHTAAGLVLAGAPLLALSWRSTKNNETSRTGWLLVTATVAGVVTSLSFWYALKSMGLGTQPLVRDASAIGVALVTIGILVTALLNALIYFARAARVRMLASQRAEQALRKSEESRFYLATIVDSTDDAVIGKDLSGIVLSWNAGAEKLYGYTAGEMVGQHVSLLCPPDRAEEPLKILQRIAGGDKVSRYETERIRKDGRRIHVFLTVSTIRDSEGRVKGASTIARDITEKKLAEIALRDSEELLRSVIDGSSDYIFVKDRKLKTGLCNKAFANALGKSIADVCGKTDIENGWDPELVRGNPKRGIRGWEADDQAALRGETIHVQHEPGNVGTEIRVFDTIKSPLRNARGEIIGLVGVARDITDRIRAEAAQKESDAAFQTLANSVPQIVWMCTPDGLNVYFNDQWAEYTGLTLEESYGQGWNTPFHPEDKRAAWDAWNHATATGDPYRIESRLRAADGSYRWFLMRGLPLRDREGKIIKWFGTCTDIHDLKQSEERFRTVNEELHKANLYNRSLIEASLDPLVTIAADGTITDVNRATEEATGFSRQALIGTDFSDYFTDRNRARDVYQTVFKEGRTQDYELSIRHRDATARPVVYNASVYRNENNEIVGVFAAARDITEVKRVESEIKQLNASLECRVAERTADLMAVNQELESFNYSVSHDLRAPLRHIDGYSKILLKQHGAEISQDGRQCIERICDGAQRMGRMVDELLELSRISRREVSKRLTGLNTLVEEVVEELEPEIQNHGVEWHIGELPFADCDPTLIHLVFANLLGNALKFSRRRKPAVIEVGCADSEAGPVFFVRDNGVGFSMKYADKLFGVFQRLHRQEDFEGTGVGLVTVQRIIHKHGGRIWAEAELERGATFYFTLGSAPPKPEPLESSTISMGER